MEFEIHIFFANRKKNQLHSSQNKDWCIFPKGLLVYWNTDEVSLVSVMMEIKRNLHTLENDNTHVNMYGIYKKKLFSFLLI